MTSQIQTVAERAIEDMNRRMRRMSAELKHQKDTEKERARKMADEMMQAQHRQMQDMYAREDQRREEEWRQEGSERKWREEERRFKLLDVMQGMTPVERAKQSKPKLGSRHATLDDRKHVDSRR